LKKMLGGLLAALLIVAMAPLASAVISRGAAKAGPAIDPRLAAQLQTAKATDRLVVFVHAADRADTAAATHAVKASGLTLVDTYDKVGIAVGAGTPSAVRKITKADGIRYVEADQAIEFFSDPEANHASRYDEARETIHDSAGSAYEGKGISIAIVDGGVDGSHPMFQRDGKSKVVRNLKITCAFLNNCTGATGDVNDQLFQDFTTTTNDTDTPSAGGHGTHVAGIAAGYDVVTADHRHLHGAAPEAKLVALSVGTSISVSAGNAGLNWVLEHHDAPCVDAAGAAYSDPVTCPPIKVVNNSYGPTGGAEFDPNSATVAIQRALVSEGIVVAWAAGNGDAANDGGDGSVNRTNPPGQDPTNGVIMVANYDDGGTGSRDNALSSSSSRGNAGRPATYPDLAAPGEAITSACRPYLSVCMTGGDTADPNYNTIGGTSMATPYIAGVVATLLSAKPDLTPAEIELTLEDTAHKFVAGAPYEADLADRNPNTTTSFDKGHGLLDVVGALNKVLGISAPLPPPAAGVCTADGPVATDPTNDAKDFAVRGSLPDSEPALDIVRLDITSDEAQNATVTVTLNELGEANPALSPNVAYDTYFTYQEHAFWVEAARAGDGTETYKVGQTIETPAATSRIPLADLTGHIDPEANTASVTLDAATLADLSGQAPRDGDALTGISSVARRSVTNEPSSQGQSGDDVDAPCPFTYGLGAVAGPPPPPLPTEFTPAPSQGTVTVDAPYEWSSDVVESTRTDLVDGDCGSTERGSGCQRVGITLEVPAGGADLTVNLTAQDLVDDYDFQVYRPDGFLVGEGVEVGGLESITEHVDAPGVYTVVVTSYSQNVTGYDADASLEVVPVEPPPPLDFEGTAAPGSPFTWEGTTPFPANPAFACLPDDPAGTGHGVGTVFCDFTNVNVQVPAGGGELTITASPDAPDTDAFTIYIYDARGNELHNGPARSGDGTYTVHVVESGVYRIAVTAFAAVAGYTGTASIA
jgi:serine protease AprX